MNFRLAQLLALFFTSAMNACGVAEGTAYLRFEGSVLTQEGIPLPGIEVNLQALPKDLSPVPNILGGIDQPRTDTTGKFAIEKARMAGGLLIIPMALIVAPFSGLIAAVTPWEYWDVHEFFSPAYLLGSYCLPHPTAINVSVGSSPKATSFSQQDIKEKLYQGKDRSHRKSCTRVYNLGELKGLPLEQPHSIREY